MNQKYRETKSLTKLKKEKQNYNSMQPNIFQKKKKKQKNMEYFNSTEAKNSTIIRQT